MLSLKELEGIVVPLLYNVWDQMATKKEFRPTDYDKFGLIYCPLLGLGKIII